MTTVEGPRQGYLGQSDVINDYSKLGMKQHHHDMLETL